MQLHAKILLVVIPMAVLPLLVLGWFAYQQLHASGEERTSNQMTILLDQLSENFQVHMNVASANAKLFANSSQMRAYALTEDEEERYLLMLPSLLKLFKSYLYAYPDYYEIRYLLPDGYEDARATLEYIPNTSEEEQGTPFFKALIQSDTITTSMVLSNPDNGKMALQVARKIKLINIATDDPIGTKPKLRGYLIVTMSLEFLAKQVRTNQIGRSGEVFVIDKNGTIIFHRDHNMDGQQIPEELLNDLLLNHEKHLHSGPIGQLKAAIYSSRQLHNDLLLVGMLPETELLEESRNLANTVALITTLTILITLIALVVAMQILMVRPLKSLVNAVDEIGRGELNPKINLSSKDELGQLASRFQDMGKNLKKSLRKIERLAYHDSLTGLPNRLLFREYLEHMIALARRENNKMAVLFLDLDNFGGAGKTGGG